MTAICARTCATCHATHSEGDDKSDEGDKKSNYVCVRTLEHEDESRGREPEGIGQHDAKVDGLDNCSLQTGLVSMLLLERPRRHVCCPCLRTHHAAPHHLLDVQQPVRRRRQDRVDKGIGPPRVEVNAEIEVCHASRQVDQHNHV